jgi:hypothetical protein
MPVRVGKVKVETVIALVPVPSGAAKNANPIEIIEITLSPEREIFMVA